MECLISTDDTDAVVLSNLIRPQRIPSIYIYRQSPCHSYTPRSTSSHPPSSPLIEYQLDIILTPLLRPLQLVQDDRTNRSRNLLNPPRSTQIELGFPLHPHLRIVHSSSRFIIGLGDQPGSFFEISQNGPYPGCLIVIGAGEDVGCAP